MPPSAHAQIYVDASASGAADGTSWSDAYTNLQDALDEADGTDEIRIAEGTYYPDEGGTATNNDRAASFRITGAQDGIEINGGYPAGGGARDLAVHTTILSGDIDGDGTPVGNSYHVFYIDGVSNGEITRATVLDGITIRDGNANGSGSASASRRSTESSQLPTADPDPEDLIPGQYIITFADAQPSPELFGNAPAWESAREAVRQRAEEVLGAATLSTTGSSSQQATDPVVERTYAAALIGFTASGLTEEVVRALRADPRIKRVEQDAMVYAGTNREDAGRGASSHLEAPSGLEAPPMTQTDAPWGLDRIDARAGLDGTYTYDRTGTGVTAYVLDSGIRPTHAEFEGRASIGEDFIGDGQNGQDCHGHGTHVAGTVGGATYGVAKEVDIVAVRVLNCQNSGSKSGVIAGMDWVAANAALPAVANMSLGGGASATQDEAVTRLATAGVTTIVAAGNDDTDACAFSPARAPDAITVGATNDGDVRASFSNYGSCVDIHAPGVDIPSAWYQSDTDVNTINGTSMAAPHVAGIAALYLEANPSVSPTDVRNALLGTATTGTISDPNGSPNLLAYSPLLEQATTAEWKGAGIYCDGTGGVCSPTLTRIVFVQNTTDGIGGALYAGGQNSGESSPLVINGLFVGNQASRGAAIYSDGRDEGLSSPIILNSTFSQNGVGVGRAIFANGSGNGISNPQTINAILAESGAEVGFNEGTTTHDHTLIEGGCPTEATCTAAVSGPVRFANALRPDGDDGTLGTPDDGLVLLGSSPALNAGSNDALDLNGDGTRDVETDLLGRSRTMDPTDTVDLGAYEGAVPIRTIYVDASATGMEDGRSWETAYTSLQAAIRRAGPIAEIWVAAGTYTPGPERTDSFTLTGAKPELKIYGGFAGTETSREQRDLSAGPATILSGDIGTPGDPSDNSYHVLYIDGQNDGPVTPDVLIDGVTITGGTANGTFPENAGGGVYCNGLREDCSPRLQNVILHGNTARYGGAIYGYGTIGNSQFQLVNAVLLNSDAEYGGAINCFGSNGVCSPVITNTTIAANTATLGGGVLSQTGNSGGSVNPQLTNVILWGNSAQDGPQLYNWSSGATPLLRHTLVEGGAGGVFNRNGGSITYANTDGTPASSFDASSNLSAPPDFSDLSDPSGADDVFGTADDGLRLTGGSPALDAGTNVPFEPGGVAESVTTDLTGAPRIQNGTGSGATAVDLGAYERAATVQPNRALTLDGTDDFVRADGVSGALADSGSDALTMEAWVYPTSTDGQQGLTTFHTSTGGNRNLLFYREGQFQYFDGTTGYVPGRNAFPAGQWYHVAFTVDASDTATLYVNGREEATFTTSVRPESGGLFSIGQEWDGGPTASDFFEGRVDEVRIWSQARTQAQLQEGMTTSLGEANTLGDTFDLSDLVAHYRFEGNTLDETGTFNRIAEGAPTYTDDVAQSTADDRLIVRVNAAVSGGAGNGTSWTDAHAALQDGLAGTGPENEVWIAAGTYTRTRRLAAGDARTATFEIAGAQNGLKIYGGFASGDAFGDRDPAANETILSGNINGDESDASGNAYHVLVFNGGDAIGPDVNANITTDTVLDGLTITGGNANDSFPNNVGGGLFCDGESTGNACSPALTGLTFTDNSAEFGGAIYNDGSFDGTSSPQITNATFTRNSAGSDGGAIYNNGADGTSNPQVTNASFTGNAASAGGAIFNNGSFGTSSPVVTNTILWGNDANDGNEIYNEDATPTLVHTLIEGGVNGSGIGGGANTDGGNNLDADPLFADADAGDVRLTAGSPAIARGTFAPFAPGGVAEDVTTDLAGDARRFGLFPDLGAYEVSTVVSTSDPITGATGLVGYVEPTGFGGLLLLRDAASGDLTFTRTEETPESPDLPENVAPVTWTVEASLDAAPTYDLVFDASSLSGIGDFGALMLYKSDNGGQTWDAVDTFSGASLVLDEGRALVAVQDLVGFSQFAIGSSDTGNPLPVELAGFEAQRSGPESVTVQWQTLSETDNAGFEVRRAVGSAGGPVNGSVESV